jgi:hypothetical protein
MKTLVYVGVNKGLNLEYLVRLFEFNKAYGFEPDPQMFYDAVLCLENSAKNSNLFLYNDKIPAAKFIHRGTEVLLLNCACSQFDGSATLHITENRVATSLSKPGPDNLKLHKDSVDVIETREVFTINLSQFLKNEKINFINYYYSDAQGSDFTVLKTLEENYIKQKLIGELMIETHGNGTSLYEGLDNQAIRFDELLNENYEWTTGIISGGGIISDKSEFDFTLSEWDTYWRLRNYNRICELRDAEQLMGKRATTLYDVANWKSSGNINLVDKIVCSNVVQDAVNVLNPVNISIKQTTFDEVNGKSKINKEDFKIKII